MLNVEVKRDVFYNTKKVDAYDGYTNKELQHVDVAGEFTINGEEFTAYLDADKFWEDGDVAYSDLDCQTDANLTDEDLEHIWDTLNDKIIETFK